MRKFMIIGLLAVPLVALTEQRASAWVKFGFSVNLLCGGKKFCFDGGQPPCTSCCNCSAPSCCAPVPYHHPHPGHPGFRPPLPAPVPGNAVPAPSAVQPTGHWHGVGYQPASYYSNTGYSNYQVPSYWYGN
jgi:hypothetical protein